MDGGGDADGELVVAGGESSMVFKVAEAAFDCMAALVGVGVEGWWPPAAGAASGAVTGLVCRDRDGGGDLVSALPGTVRAGGIGLVGQDPLRALSGSSASGSGDVDAVQDSDHLGAVTVLPGGDQEGQHARRASTAAWDWPPTHRGNDPRAWCSGSPTTRSVLSRRAPAAWMNESRTRTLRHGESRGPGARLEARPRLTHLS